MVFLSQEDGDEILLEDGNNLLVEPAVVRILPATDVSPTTATLNAEILILYSADVDGFFEYKELSEMSWTATSPVTYNTVGTLSVGIGGLNPDETYEFRFVVQKNSMTEMSGTTEFLAVTFSVTFVTKRISNVLAVPGNGTLSVDVTAFNTPSIVVQFRYKKSSDSDWDFLNPILVAVTGIVTDTVTSLDTVDYQVQPVFTFQGHTLYGDVLTFPVGQPMRIFDNGVKGFDLGYDDSLNEVVYVNQF